MKTTPVLPSMAYIAGFFDGEGCITVRTGPHNAVVATFVQAARTDAVLAKIQAALTHRGIESRLYGRIPKPVAWQPQQCLAVSQVRAAKKLLCAMLPYLIVKKEKAIKALSFIDENAWRTSKIPVETLEAARSLYSSGMSFRASAQRYGIDSGTLRRYMLANGERGRSRSQAVTSWHQAMSPTKRRAMQRSLRMAAKERPRAKS